MGRYSDAMYATPATATELIEGSTRLTTDAEAKAAIQPNVALDPSSLSAALNDAAGPNALQASVGYTADNYGYGEDSKEIVFFRGTAPAAYMLCDGQSTAGNPTALANFGATVPALYVAPGATATLLDTTLPGSSSGGLIQASDGYLYYSVKPGYAGIRRIDPITGAVTTFFDPSFFGYEDLCQHPNTNLYAVDAGFNRISEVTLAGVATLAFISPVPSSADRIIYHSSGDFYLTSTGGGAYTIHKVTFAGVVTTLVTNASVERYDDIKEGTDGNIWAITDLGRLLQITTAGVVTAIATGLSTLNRRLSPLGTFGFLLVDLFSNQIKKISYLGVVSNLYSLGIDPTLSIQGLDGNVYLAVGSGDLYKVAPSSLPLLPYVKR
jgi:hypothetical protein